MSCSPPYCKGSGGFCNCNCNCCPPSPCYTSWVYSYDCGSPSSQWNPSIVPNLGCNCTQIYFTKYKPTQAENDGYVFIQGTGGGGSGGPCSTPCTKATATLTSNACCLNGTGNSFVVIGTKGQYYTATLTLNNPTCATSMEVSLGSTSGGTFHSGTSVTITVPACTTINAGVLVPQAVDCCVCCKPGTSNPGNQIAFRSKKITPIKTKFISKTKKSS